MALMDSGMLVVALWISFSLRLGELYLPDRFVFLLMMAAPFFAIPVFIRFGLYRAIVRYIGFKALWAILLAVSLYALFWALLLVLSGVHGVPRSVVILNWLVTMLLIGGSRMMMRWWVSDLIIFDEEKNTKRNVIIYGAGSAGMQLASVLSYSNEIQPVAFIDDKKELHRCHINALRVYSFTHLSELIEKKNVSEILLAIPSVSRTRRHEIIQLLEPYPVHVRTLPAMEEVAGGQIRIEDLKEVDIEDLLGRDRVQPNDSLLSKDIKNKVVMVSGAGGSIGSELCRQIVKQKPKQLVLYEWNEYALYTIARELTEFVGNENYGDGYIVSILGSVTDENRLLSVLSSFGVDSIYHAAAYKHVPLVERNPIEAITNNIFGTHHISKAAIKAGVGTFVLISTDKAVRPTNIMGASKRFAELILQSFGNSKNIGTKFSIVRFGNVLDSSGSVIPLFREQIRKGGPVTVTDPKIIRYFMTIPEAAELVIQAGSMGSGGEIFVLDMGEPVKILDLAKSMIHLSGLEVKDADHPNGDIEITYTGLRPGEKLYEELLIDGGMELTEHELILRAAEKCLDQKSIMQYLDVLSDACKQYDHDKIRDVLLKTVNGFVPREGICDYVYKKSKKELSVDNVHNIFKN